MSLFAALALVVLGAAAFAHGRARALAVLAAAPAGQGPKLHSRPPYHGAALALATVGPAALMLIAYAVSGDAVVNAQTAQAHAAALDTLSRDEARTFLRDARAIAEGADAIVSQRTSEREAAARTLAEADARLTTIIMTLMAVLAALGFWRVRAQVAPAFRARQMVERTVLAVLFVCSAVAILTTGGIVASLLTESLRFFTLVSPWEFFFGLNWDPQIGVREDQITGAGSFGVVPLLYGTVFITAIALAVAGPVGLFAATYLSEYATPRARAVVKPILEILAGVPTVVYGFFALLTLGPAIREAASLVGLSAPAQTALAAGLVMGVMIIPFVSSLSDDVINATPQSLRDGSYALGATPSETVRFVLLPAAAPGLAGAMMLAVSRAAGETMIVVMAAGLADAITLNPLDSVTTVTAQIVNLLVGDQAFDSAKTLSAFALGLTLFVFTLIANLAALRVVRRHQARYE